MAVASKDSEIDVSLPTQCELTGGPGVLLCDLRGRGLLVVDGNWLTVTPVLQSTGRRRKGKRNKGRSRTASVTHS